MQIDKILNSVDWNFSDAPANTGIHAIHPYPAKFIPQIPRRLIELFHHGDSSVVLDPFCGSGTTLVEAINLGFDATGVDLNPLACLLAKVKTTPLPGNFEERIKRVVRGAREQLSSNDINIPDIPRLDHWFKHDVQRALATLTQQINQEEDEPVRNALQIALSSIIVRVSNQESDTRYAAIEKKVSGHGVIANFEKAASSLYISLLSFSNDLFRKAGSANVMNRDILSLTPDDFDRKVGLVVTSPPYPNAYEYWLYHKYRMYWLGMEPLGVRQREIGARPHYFKKNCHDEWTFERQMGEVFFLLAQIMKFGAKACFLVGRSIIHGRVIDNAALLQCAAEPHGFAVRGIVERRIPATRKTFNPAHSKISREHLIVFELEKKHEN